MAGRKQEAAYTADLAELPALRAFIRDAAQTPNGPLSSEEADQLVLAAHEAAANIIVHAYGRAPDRRLGAAVETNGECARVELSHTGEAFHPQKQKPPSPSGENITGFGMYIMEKSVDRVEYRFNQKGRHLVILTKMGREDRRS